MKISLDIKRHSFSTYGLACLYCITVHAQNCQTSTSKVLISSRRVFFFETLDNQASAVVSVSYTLSLLWLSLVLS